LWSKGLHQIEVFSRQSKRYPIMVGLGSLNLNENRLRVPPSGNGYGERLLRCHRYIPALMRNQTEFAGMLEVFAKTSVVKRSWWYYERIGRMCHTIP
jgi:hypothetical protein